MWFWKVLSSFYQGYNFTIQWNCNMVIWNRTGNSTHCQQKIFTGSQKIKISSLSVVCCVTTATGIEKATGKLVKGNVFSYFFYYIRVSSYWKLSVILGYQVSKIKYYTLCPARNKQIYIFKKNLNSFNSYSDLKIWVKRNTTMIENTDDESPF